jgi:16S rRNA (guanine527-N7)-methyltransferase
MQEDDGIIEGMLRAVAEESGVSGEQAGRLELFARELLHWSGKMHLVGRRDIRRTLQRQLVDSLLMLGFAEGAGALESGKAARVADIGAGSGFPGIVWKIVRPELEIALIERKTKAARFLERVIALMEMEGIAAIEGDAGRIDRKGHYDLVVSKAAGRLPELLPIAEILLGQSGAYLTVKGSDWKDELPTAGTDAMHLEATRELAGGRGTMLLYRKRPLNHK